MSSPRREGRRPGGGYQPRDGGGQGSPPQGGSGLVPAPPQRAAAPPRPRPKVFRCYGEDPGLTREATPEQIAEWGGAPFCPACGCRMGEDLTGRA